jgi:catechol 2,3-dioxygenase-like lactoylglutathione lyase family enzyme
MWTAGMVGRRVATIAAIGLVALPTVAAAQNRGRGGPAPAGDVVGAGNFIHVVGDLDRTVAFYTTLLGVKPNGDAMNRPYAANQPVATMYNTSGSKFRGATFKVPNSDLGLEFIEWQGNRSPAVKARVFDPGAPVIVLQVRSIEAGIEAVKQHGGSFVTPNGEPVRFSSERFSPRRLMIVRDPDGYFVELINPDQSPESPDPGNVLGATDDPVLGKMMALGTVLQRFAGSTVPGSTLGLQFAEYDKLEGKKVEQGLPRPGTSMLRLMVRDLDASLAKAKAAGATAAPGSDPPVTLENGRRMAVVLSPDGLLLQLAEAAK